MPVLVGAVYVTVAVCGFPSAIQSGPPFHKVRVLRSTTPKVHPAVWSEVLGFAPQLCTLISSVLDGPDEALMSPYSSLAQLSNCTATLFVRPV